MGAGFFSDLDEDYSAYFVREVDFDRTWGGVDGGQVVATLRSFATELTVPGPACIPTAALTNVTVAATHRRQGLLTKMITSDLAASVDRGEHAGILIASEYLIYGRFGYGPAIDAATYVVDSTQAKFRTPGVGTIERVDAPTMRREAPPVYDRFRKLQAGSIVRSANWWDRVLRQVEVPGKPPPKSYFALYRSPAGDVDGYVRYRGEQDWDAMRPQGKLVIDDLCATTTESYRRLWQYCCDIDLMTSVEAGTRSVDEPLVALLGDARVVKQTARHDFVWVRPLDVPALLSARRYAVDGRLVIEIADSLGFATGRYALEGGPAGASCTRTDGSAELTMPVDSLGTICAGGASFYALSEAGRIDEHRAGALAKAAAMFTAFRAPWCNTWF